MTNIEQPTAEEVSNLEAVIGRCPSTATALLALANVLHSYDDPAGAELVAAFAARFWEHEQTTM